MVESLEDRRLLAGQLFAGEAFAVGGSPAAVVAADFNGDGRTDLATAGAVSSIALGRGDGTFQAAKAIQMNPGGVAVALAVGDWDADGRRDLVVASTSSSSANQGSVTIFRGNGDGTVSAGTSYAINASPLAVTIGDVNNDARPDIVVANRNITGGNASLILIASNGIGGFNSPVMMAMPFSVRDVAAADLDADGKVDLVVATEFGAAGLAVLHGHGDGTFAAPAAVVSGTDYATVVSDDLNDDGVPDLAATVANGAQLTVQFGNGDGMFAAPVVYGIGGTAADLVRADMNADGKPDLVTANGFGNTITALLNDGAGHFSANTVPSGYRSVGVVVSDFNADGRPDAAVALRSSDVVAVLGGQGDGTFVAAIPTSTTASPALAAYRSVAGEFNGDGILDLAVANANDEGSTTAASVGLRLGNGDGTFALPGPRYPIQFTPVALVRGDFDGNGVPDLAVASDGQLAVLLGAGDGTFAAPLRTTTAGGVTAATAGDFNGDGRTDLAVLISQSVRRYNGSATGRLVSVAGPPAGEVSAVAAADFDRDGDVDLAVVQSYNRALLPLLNDGSGTFVPQTAVSNIAGDRLIAADFNGDGAPDLAAASRSDSTVTSLLNNWNGAFTPQSTFSTVFQPAQLAAADFNADGRADLAVLGQDVVHVHLSAGGGAFAGPNFVPIGLSLTSLATGDFTGDGRPDLLTTTQNRITVTPSLPPVTLVADPAVSMTGGVLTLGPGSIRLEASTTSPKELLVTTATRQIRLAADALTKVVLSGVAMTINTDLGPLTGNAVALTVSSGATATLAVSQHLSMLTVMGTAVLKAGGGRLLRVTDISNFPNGRLDLNDNALIYDHAFGGGAARSTIRNLIKTARSGGTWAGAGLTSTVAKNAEGANTTLGYMDAADYKAMYGAAATFAGEATDSTAVLVQYTLYGDANFDRAVDFNDFLRLQNGFGTSNASFAQGDFDYTGTTDFNDFLILQNHFGQVLPASPDGATIPIVPPTPVPPAPVQVTPKTAAIRGVAFNDANRNGRYDRGDSLAAGKTMWLDSDDDGIQDANERAVVTDKQGRYAFTGLPTGKYHVRRLFPKGYKESTPAAYVTLAPGQAAANVHVGSKLA